MRRGTKFISVLLVFIMVFSMLPSLNLFAIDLSSFSGVTSFAEGNHNLIIDVSSSGIDYKYNNEYVTIRTIDATDPYFSVNLVDASMSNKVMAIKYKGCAGTSISNAWLYPDTSAGGWGPSAAGLFHAQKMVLDGSWNLTTYDIPYELIGADCSSIGTADQLNATIYTMRIGGSNTLYDTVDIAYIGFFDSVEQAQDYDDLFCEKYPTVVSSRAEIIPYGLHYVPEVYYDFQESSVTNGLSLVGSTTNLNSDFLVKGGTGASTYVVNGSNKYLNLKYDSVQMNKFFNNNCPYVFSADIKPEELGSHFAGFVFNFGNENAWELNQFFETNGLEGSNSVSKSGINVNIHPSVIEINVLTYSEETRKLSQIKYTHALDYAINDAFHNFKAVDDANGTIRFLLDGEVFAYVTYSDSRPLASSVIDYKERYYRAAAIYDANNNLKASTSDALISYVKSMAMGSRLRAIAIDNIDIGYYGYINPTINLSSYTASENDIITANINYGDYIAKDLWLGIYDTNDSCGSGMGTSEPLYKYNLNRQNSISFPKLSAGNYYAVIMEGNHSKSDYAHFTINNVAKTADLYIDDTETNIGSTVRIPIVLNKNQGLNSLSVYVSWSSSAFTPKSATNGIVMGNASYIATKATNSYTLTWSGTSNTSVTGTIAYIELEAKPGATLGDNQINIAINSAASASGDVTSSITTAPGQVKVKDSTLKFDGITLSLSSDITVKYLVRKDLFDSAGFTQPYMEVVFAGQSKTISYSTSTISGVAYYSFIFEEVAPQMMNDVIYATLKATKDGVVWSSKTKEYSVSTYIYNKITTTDPSFKQLLVDMLNYGAASQIYIGYNLDNLVNNKLTAEQKKYGTNNLRNLTTVKNIPTASTSDKATWLGMGLYLENKVALKGFFDTTATDGVYVKVMNSNNNIIDTISSSELEVVSTSQGVTRYSYIFDTLSVAQMSETVKFVVCDSTGAEISGVYVYSIESYIYTAKDSDDENLANLSKTILKYGDSAVNYLESQNTTYGTLTPSYIGSNFYARITIQGKALTLSGDNVQLGTPSTYDASQYWKFVRLENGAYRIINKANNKSLAVSGSGTSNATNVIIANSNESKSQQWYIYQKDYYYSIRPAHCDNMSLDVSNASYTNGSNIQIYTTGFSTNQLFHIPDRTEEVNLSSSKMTNAELVNKIITEAQNVSNFMRANRFTYGHAMINPGFNWGALSVDKALDPSEKIVSCDRFVDWVLYRVGFTDQLFKHGHVTVTLVDWCKAHGFTRINNRSDLQRGDIVFSNVDSQGLPIHTFICASSMDSAGRFLRYDAGSNARITGTTGTEVTKGRQPFLETIGDFMFAYRPNVNYLPETTVNIYEKSLDSDSRPAIGGRALYNAGSFSWSGNSYVKPMDYKYQPGKGYNQFQFQVNLKASPSTADKNYWNSCFIGARVPSTSSAPNSVASGVWVSFSNTKANIYFNGTSWPNSSVGFTVPIDISYAQQITVVDSGDAIKYFYVNSENNKKLLLSITIDEINDKAVVWNSNNSFVAAFDAKFDSSGYFSMWNHLANTTVSTAYVSGAN